MSEDHYFYDKKHCLHTPSVQAVKEVVKLIGNIPAMDPETAHKTEDDLHHAILLEAVNGNPNIGEMAREALKTDKIDFGRWYA